MSNSQSAHDISACDDDDGYGEIGVYARRSGTVTAAGDSLSESCLSFIILFMHVMCMPVVCMHSHTCFHCCCPKL